MAVKLSFGWKNLPHVWMLMVAMAATWSNGSLLKQADSSVAILISKGDLGSRIQEICTAKMLSRHAGLNLSVVWRSDTWLPATRFQELFAIDALDFEVISDLKRRLVVEPSWKLWTETVRGNGLLQNGMVEACESIVDGVWNTGESMLQLAKAMSFPASFYVHETVSICNLLPPVTSSMARRSIHDCFSQLKPSARVMKLLPKLSDQTSTVGVFLQTRAPYAQPLPIPLSTHNLVRKTPLVSAYWLASLEESNVTLHVTAGQNMVRAMVMEVFADPRVKFFIGGGSREVIQEVVEAVHEDRALEALSFSDPQLRILCSQLSEGLATETQVSASRRDRVTLVACMRRQLAEFVGLSATKTVLFLKRSGAAEYIMAQAESSDWWEFQRQVAIEDRPPLPMIITQKWARWTYVSEKHSLLYCSIPKVACTAIRLWMRRLEGLSDFSSNESYKIHDPAFSGIKKLGFNFTEPQAIKIVTDPNVYKFVFVRNPWRRALSVFSDKIVRQRKHQNKLYYNVFFDRLNKTRLKPDKIFQRTVTDFEEYLRLLEDAMKINRTDIDRHIQLQSVLCSLDVIKYNFVGHVESIYDDIDSLRKILPTGRQANLLPPLPVGDRSHKTNSSTVLRLLYSPELVEIVERIYSNDLNITLNNIFYESPV